MTGKRYEGHTFRLLPGTGAEGKPSYVLGDGTGPVSRMAASIEDIRLGMAGDLIDHAADLLADRKVTGVELHFLASRLSESLREVLQVAECRGAWPDANSLDPDTESPARRDP
ncbi:hypothetical protein [Streptomyces atroolivaceus]|uniref:Uncharacterized protein n=1 Tax=Streptomyces atroolivaceus TaxID=66869 RepID=A0ABV9V4X6_STRAZ|nr:hypothetical protein [Streptomyces atroolivaceus]